MTVHISDHGLYIQRIKPGKIDGVGPTKLNVIALLFFKDFSQFIAEK